MFLVLSSSSNADKDIRVSKTGNAEDLPLLFVRLIVFHRHFYNSEHLKFSKQTL
jgi:hypothetical protein